MLTAVTVLVDLGILAPRPTRGAAGTEYQEFDVLREPTAHDRLDPLQFAVGALTLAYPALADNESVTELALPLDRIAYCHVAGAAPDTDGVYHETPTPTPCPTRCSRWSGHWWRPSGRCR